MDWFEKVQRYYNWGYYTDEQVAMFVKAGKITERQYEIITGKEYVAEDIEL